MIKVHTTYEITDLTHRQMEQIFYATGLELDNLNQSDEYTDDFNSLYPVYERLGHVLGLADVFGGLQWKI